MSACAGATAVLDILFSTTKMVLKSRQSAMPPKRATAATPMNNAASKTALKDKTGPQQVPVTGVVQIIYFILFYFEQLFLSFFLYHHHTYSSSSLKLSCPKLKNDLKCTIARISFNITFLESLFHFVEPRLQNPTNNTQQHNHSASSGTKPPPYGNAWTYSAERTAHLTQTEKKCDIIVFNHDHSCCFLCVF